jgi:hypothetical protein
MGMYFRSRRISFYSGRVKVLIISSPQYLYDLMKSYIIFCIQSFDYYIVNTYYYISLVSLLLEPFTRDCIYILFCNSRCLFNFGHKCLKILYLLPQTFESDLMRIQNPYCQDKSENTSVTELFLLGHQPCF